MDIKIFYHNKISFKFHLLIIIFLIYFSFPFIFLAYSNGTDGPNLLRLYNVLSCLFIIFLFFRYSFDIYQLRYIFDFYVIQSFCLFFLLYEFLILFFYFIFSFGTLERNNFGNHPILFFKYYDSFLFSFFLLLYL